MSRQVPPQPAGDENALRTLRTKNNDEPLAPVQRRVLGDVSNRNRGRTREPLAPVMRDVPESRVTDTGSSGAAGESALAGQKRSADALEPAPKRARRVEEASASQASFVIELPRIEVEHADLDAEDKFDELMVPEYVDDIFDLLFQRQYLYMVNPSYMKSQPQIKWSLRGILVNWLVSIHQKFRLLGETLFVTINILDRYLEKVEVPLDRLQLVGVTCLFIAAKYEEIFSPAIQNYAYVATVTETEICQTEMSVLRVLDYDLGVPNPMNFLRRISKADNYNISSRTLAKYLMEISFFEPRLFCYLPSDVAAASMCLAREIVGSAEWDNNCIHYSMGLTREAMKNILLILVQFLKAPTEYPEFHKKYASKKFLKASLRCAAWAEAYSDSWLASFDE